MKKCDWEECQYGAFWKVFAAGYPMPMYHACWTHLPSLLNRDLQSPGSTKSWTVEPCHT